MAREDQHFRLRIPDALKTEVEAAAERNRRSMTAEIVARLAASFGTAETLRDRFAIAALTGLCGNDDALHRYIPEKIAEWAYQYADAMLAQREKR
ncbi:MAG: Arc family DNA-binding protein [Mesorhizobium sp.]